MNMEFFGRMNLQLMGNASLLGFGAPTAWFRLFSTLGTGIIYVRVT
jgi:hypothetical protein